jgi:hypothetical protein
MTVWVYTCPFAEPPVEAGNSDESCRAFLRRFREQVQTPPGWYAQVPWAQFFDWCDGADGQGTPEEVEAEWMRLEREGTMAEISRIFRMGNGLDPAMPGVVNDTDGSIELFETVEAANAWLAELGAGYGPPEARLITASRMVLR